MRSTRRANLVLLLASVAAALLLSEAVLRLLGLPEEHRPHSGDWQFVPVKGADFVYTNAPNAAIRFTYDSNPRGYFGPGNEIVHHTNAQGFRGPPFSIKKAPDTLRFLFLGDSFTFGEGVKDEDTYVARFEALVRAAGLFPGKTFEALNFGVGGYNTIQEAALLRQFGVVVSPDRIYLGYCLNDAEPLLFTKTADGAWERRQRGAELPENVGTPQVPSPWRFSRLTRLAWLALKAPAESRRTIEHYRSLYAPGSSTWARTRAALAEIAALAREHGIPASVIVFPVFFELDHGYPFLDLHRQVCESVTELGMECIDLYPVFERFHGPELWVHPGDQHPDEQAHRLAAERIFDALKKEANASGAGEGRGGDPGIARADLGR